MELENLARDCEICEELMTELAALHTLNGHGNVQAKVCARDRLIEHLWQYHRVKLSDPE